jgi:GGDEF domain-containing protein
MEEIVKKKKNKLESIDILIIVMMAVVAILGLVINEFELKLISAILFIIGGLVFFLARSSRRKEIDQTVISDEVNSIDENTSITAVKNNDSVFSASRDEEDSINHRDDFVIIKSIPNHQKKNSAKQSNDDCKQENNNGNSVALKSNKEITERSETKPEPEQNTVNSNIPIFDNGNYSPSGKDPKSEFSIFLQNILGIIKEVTFAHSVLFYWVDTDRKLIVFDSWNTSSENFCLKKKDSFDYGSNLVSRIAENAKAEIVTNINPDSIRDLLGYYGGEEKVKSVIGIPIFFEENLVAVLIVDSLEEDAYGNETVGQLNHFIRLLSSLIKSSTEKFEYYTDSKILNKIDEIHNTARAGSDLNLFIREVSQEIKELIDWDFSSLILEEGNDWVVKDVMKKDPLKSYVSLRQKVDLSNSMVGTVIKENKFSIVDDVSELNLPRFAANEKIFSAGSFLIMPVYSFSHTCGAMIFESSRTNFYNTEDANLLNKVCKSIASLIEIVALKNYIDERITNDHETGILKYEVMLKQLASELERQSDTDISGVFLLLSIDKHDELIYKYGMSGFNTVLMSIIEILKSSIPSYDFLGRAEDNVIGIFRTGLNIDDGKVFAEKIRKLVAGNIISVDTKSFSVTVSIGFVETHKFNSNTDMVDNCMKVLKIAFEEGGNRVKIN